MTLGDALQTRGANDQLARRALQLLKGSALRPPNNNDDLGLWLATNYEHHNLLSTGEQIILHLALAIYDGDTTCRVAQLRKLDRENRQAAARIIAEYLGAT